MRQPKRITRREALISMSGVLLGSSLTPEWTAAAEPDTGFVDAHVHLVNTNLPGVPSKVASYGTTTFPPFDPKTAETLRKQLLELVETEMKAAQVRHLICMPRREISDQDPLGIKETVALAAMTRNLTMHPIGFAHPERFDEDHLKLVEKAIRASSVKGLKIYLGYLQYGPSWRGYRAYYELAGQCGIPVIFHTGDTYSKTAKLKYAHPLLIDEVAVDHPKTKFVMAHFGNPWIMTAAEVTYKNENVWADLSGILIGNEKYFSGLRQSGALARNVARIKEGIAFAESARKFLFGSDWPHAPVAAYRDFVREMFPEKVHDAVFRSNAVELFRLT